MSNDIQKLAKVIEFNRKKDFISSNYEIDKFTVTWEDLGLSYCGTLQIDYLTRPIDEDSRI